MLTNVVYTCVFIAATTLATTTSQYASPTTTTILLIVCIIVFTLCLITLTLFVYRTTTTSGPRRRRIERTIHSTVSHRSTVARRHTINSYPHTAKLTHSVVRTTIVRTPKPRPPDMMTLSPNGSVNCALSWLVWRLINYLNLQIFLNPSAHVQTQPHTRTIRVTCRRRPLHVPQTSTTCTGGRINRTSTWSLHYASRTRLHNECRRCPTSPYTSPWTIYNGRRQYNGPLFASTYSSPSPSITNTTCGLLLL